MTRKRTIKVYRLIVFYRDTKRRCVAFGISCRKSSRPEGGVGKRFTWVFECALRYAVLYGVEVEFYYPTDRNRKYGGREGQGRVVPDFDYCWCCCQGEGEGQEGAQEGKLHCDGCDGNFDVGFVEWDILV